MKYSVALGAALCASVAIAAPGPQPTRSKGQRHHHKNVPGHSEKFVGFKSNNAPGRSDIVADNQQNGIWSGGVLNALEGDTLTSVAASFTVPTPSVPDGQPAGQYSGAAWVGIDGTEEATGLWQAGAQWGVDNTVDPPVNTYGVWYEWIPDPLIAVPDFPVAAGDVISVSLISTSPTEGQVVIADETSGQTTTISTVAPASPTATLIGHTVEWITEDLSGQDGALPFANYGSVAFTECSHGSVMGPGDATGSTLLDLAQNGQVLSSAAMPNGGEIDTTYV